jgi:hypothetical protein
VAETSGLLNRRRGITPTEGSNPSVSARYPFAAFRRPHETRRKPPLFLERSSRSTVDIRQKPHIIVGTNDGSRHVKAHSITGEERKAGASC